MKKLIHVVAAVIQDKCGHILLAQRPVDKHQGGLWEFPGGKVEAGEPAVDALCRELDEELGITLRNAMPLIRIPHHYPDKSVLLDVYTVDAFEGEPYGREGQPVRWIAPAELVDYEFPAANKPVVTAALLADRFAITPPGGGQSDADFVTAVLSALDKHSLTQLMFRAPELSDAQYFARARALQAALQGRNVTLVLNGSLEQAQQLNVEALHLNSQHLHGLQNRAQFSGRWLGASCHNTEELAMAVEKGLDYVTLSPVQMTASHPGASVLGWDNFAVLIKDLPLPVYALGGMSEADLELARLAGAQGVAAIRTWFD
ncbi:MAG: Nudix family hydrolase [Marinobacterium sp.]|nr:Nudix family hydrolase [Marinobacterium sp.]